MAMEIHYLKVGALETNCYLLKSGREIGIIDPGGEPEKILEEIKELGGESKYIINTHSHPDHTLANKELEQATGAVILTPEEGEEIKIGDSVLKIISTPGHTKDSICLLGENFIFTGDTLFKGGFGRTDLAGGSQEGMKKSLEKLSKTIKTGMVIYPGHGENFKYKI